MEIGSRQAPASPGGGELNVYGAIASNRRRTVLLIAFFVVLTTALGYLLGEIFWPGSGLYVVPLAFAIAAVAAAASYYAGDRVVLGLAHAVEVDEAGAPELFHVVDALATGAGIPRPRIFIVEDHSPNAFATGRDPTHASIAVTSGLLTKLNRSELEGVIAHELSHVRNRDTRLMLVVAVLLGMAALISDLMLRSLWFGGGRRSRQQGAIGLVLLVAGLVLAILAPIIAQLVRLAISRQREYLADASGALLTRYPVALASALRKIASDPTSLSTANQATAPLYFANPLEKRHRWLDSAFDTHPPIEDRIRRLESM